MNVFFDVQEIYYLPQYLPISERLGECGVQSTFVLYGFTEAELGSCVLPEGAVIEVVDSEQVARDFYMKEKPGWLVIGNNLDGLEDIHLNTKTALVSHGIGPKACYYDVSDSATSVRFVEGPYRTRRLQEKYPDQVFLDTGYAKLDPVINGQLHELKPSVWGLDDTKKTILYAPTFYPSSIECLPKDFPEEFGEYNLIVKPHYFSLAKAKYKGQKKRLEEWDKYDNVYLASVEDINIISFMAVSDVLVSDASSTLFEFAALDKPVVWCDFYKLRWGYRGLFKFRFKKRMDEDLYKYADIALHAESYSELRGCVDDQIKNPDSFAMQRQRCVLDLAGMVDGLCSERIVNYMLGGSEFA